jgi:DNA-binding LytR/AlgR family response regulator
MNRKLSQFVLAIKNDFKLLLSISLGVFLFVLFFQPFPLDNLDFNNRLLFVAGLGAIIFLLMVVVKFLGYLSFKNYESNDQGLGLPVFTGGFIVFALSSVAFAFYLRYVGSVSITFYIMLKVVLICLASLVVLNQLIAFRHMKDENKLLRIGNEILPEKIDNKADPKPNQLIRFISENNNDNLELLLSDIAFIKSADNYVEIVHREGDHLKKNLIRNTLRNIEQQLKPYSNFIRCHRICIVNTQYAEKLLRNFNNNWLIMKGYNERIPVSHRYLLKLKESI